MREARSWGEPGGVSLFDQPVTVVGGGGIATVLLRLLEPFRARVTVVRRLPEPVPGAAETIGSDRLAEALPGALAVVLTLALTPQTRGLIGRAELAAMGSGSWLVNVARGGLVDTGALTDALRAGQIGGAALDVTDPEPLPSGHPLFYLPNCLITPHTADTEEMTRPLLADRIAENVRRLKAGQQLVGQVDPDLGYLARPPADGRGKLLQAHARDRLQDLRFDERRRPSPLVPPVMLRSAVLFAHVHSGSPSYGLDHRTPALDVITERFIPGRAPRSAAPAKRELAATMVLTAASSAATRPGPGR